MLKIIIAVYLILCTINDGACMRIGGKISSQIHSTVTKESPNVSFQLMITNEMRKTLTEDLLYQPEEVEEMEPQVAAGVIKRMLPRPLNGMPKEWRRPKVVQSMSSKATQKLILLMGQTKNKLVHGFAVGKIYTNKYIMPVAPGLVLISLLLYDQNKVINMTKFIINETKRLPHNLLSLARRALPVRRTSDRDDEERVDMEAFLRVQHLSLWDRLVLRVNRLVHRKHDR